MHIEETNKQGWRCSAFNIVLRTGKLLISSLFYAHCRICFVLHRYSEQFKLEFKGKELYSLLHYKFFIDGHECTQNLFQKPYSRSISPLRMQCNFCIRRIIRTLYITLIFIFISHLLPIDSAENINSSYENTAHISSI